MGQIKYHCQENFGNHPTSNIQQESSTFEPTADFVDLIQDHSIRLSKDGKGRWVDNAFVERLWKSVKYEEVYLHAYDSVAQATLKRRTEREAG
jgi:hypothetical protein